ncbi:MAG: hypothetical protein HZA54_07525 [Planctomycetes bacterium]|nr:hypothetical protein [Planctomycetota bacterium]
MKPRIPAPVMVGLVLAAAAVLRADVAPSPLTTGGTNLTARTAPLSVEMKWEEVDLHPSPARQQVQAVFGMLNTGKENVSLEVGFPSNYGAKLQDFVATVNGVAAKAELKQSQTEGRKSQTVHWMCWNVEFPAGQETRIEVRYWVKPDRVFHYLWTQQLPPDLQARLWGYSTGYVLHTGAGWAGKIGKATVRIHYDATTQRSMVTRLRPQGWSFDAAAGTDTLVLSDLEPTEESDVAYDFRQVSSQEEEYQLLAAAMRAQRLDPWALQRTMIDVEGSRREKPGDEDYVAPAQLAEPERIRRALEILEYTVPPVGPSFVQADLSAGAAEVVRAAFERLARAYDAAGMKEKLAAVLPHYRSWVEEWLKGHAAVKGTGGYSGGEYARCEQEHAWIVERMGGK